MNKKNRSRSVAKIDKADIKPVKKYSSIGRRIAATKTRFLRSLKMKMGVVSAASQETGICRQTYYDWLNTDPDFRRKVELINEHAIDYVESKLFEGIRNGDRQLIQFFLSTRGKKRGYTTKIEVQQDKRSTVQLNVTQFEDEY